MRRTWLFGILCTLLIVVLLVYTIRLQRKIVFQDARTNLNSLLNSVEMDLNRVFFGLDQLFLGVENYLDAYAAQEIVDPPQTRRIIDDLVLQNNYLTAVMVIDADGQVLHWNNNYQKPNISQREYFHVHTVSWHDGLYIGRPQESLLNKGQWIFGISKALRKPDGSLDKVLAAIVDVKYFYRQYLELFSQSNASLTISSPDGVIYSHIPEHDRFVGKPHKTVVDSLLGGLQEQIGSDGEVVLTETRSLADYPLILSIGKPKVKALAAWYKSAMSYSLISCLACVALLYLTYRTALHQKNEAQVKAELKRQAISDPLTNLANRRYVLEEGQREIKKAQRSESPFSLVMLDLDYFKRINDEHGHQVGDEILLKVAALLRESCRESDTISRFGGEEFLLLLPATDVEGAVTMAKKICEKFARDPFATSAGPLRLTASLGVTQCGEDEVDINGVLRRADKALYLVKNSGRNGVKWLPSDSRDDNKSYSFWLEQRLK